MYHKFNDTSSKKNKKKQEESTFTQDDLEILKALANEHLASIQPDLSFEIVTDSSNKTTPDPNSEDI